MLTGNTHQYAFYIICQEIVIQPHPVSRVNLISWVSLISPSTCLPLLRQQYAQALAQQKAAALSSAPVQQQQQHQQQINLLLQQYQALKLRLITTTHNIALSYLLVFKINLYPCCSVIKYYLDFKGTWHLLISIYIYIFLCFCRASESLLPPVTRSLSVPDSGSVWEMQNSSSQASCTPNLQQAAPSSEFLPEMFCTVIFLFK